MTGKVNDPTAQAALTATRRETIGLGLGTALAFAAADPATAARVPSSPRTRTRLDCGWRFHLGHAADSARDFGFGLDQRTFAKAGVTSPATLAGFDDRNWAEVRVPHDWAIDLPYAPPLTAPPEVRADAAAAHGFKAIGRDHPQNSIGWYRLALPIAATNAGDRFALAFDGVFRDARMFVNGYAVTREESGYVPFSVDITDFLDPHGANQLALRVDASLGEGWFYEGAGIYRNVDLVRTGPVYVPPWGVFVRSDGDAARATVRVTTEIAIDRASDASVTVRHRIRAPGGGLVAQAAGEPHGLPAWARSSDEAVLAVTAPERWSVNEPRLYTLETELIESGVVVDRIDTRFGIRSIAFDPERGFLLNGAPVKLLGTCNHQDHAGVGTAIPDALHAWRVAQLRGMGSNAWRSAHNPPAQALLDACDFAGMMMVSEARLNSTSEQATDELTRMVRAGRNHPCVILWSVGNEEPQQGTQRGANISAAMRRHVLALDPTRAVIQAFDGSFDAAIGKGAARVVDVIGFNYRTEQIPAFHARHPAQPIVGTETGSTVSTRGAYANDAATHIVRAYDTEHPWWASTAEEWWQVADAHPYVAGGFVWTGFDYRGEPTPFPSWPSVSSYFGVLDLCGFPKDNYWYYRAQWRAEPIVHLLPHWTWPGLEGQPIEVWAYTNCETVELRVNGRSLGRRASICGGHARWDVAYIAGRIEVIGYREGRRVAADRHQTAGAAHAIELTADRARIAADGRDVAVIAARVIDARGTSVPDAANEIAFAIEGPARVLGTGNGDPTGHVPDASRVRPAFHALCQAIVQADAVPGIVRVSARAAGLKPATLALITLPTPSEVAYGFA